MAIINDIVTRFSTRGQEKVAKGTQQITRAQTRLGQASASAGRQFSSQAQGLGGLVSAYAGAAATIFAITQAFDALNRAAQAEQTVAGVNALATTIGESGPQILENLQRITKGQLSVAESAKAANLALSSGFSGEQIEGLADIATKASRALGVPLSNAFERLTRGVVKLEPELLDELGIFTRIEPAAERFASKLGKVASQLSNFEKRQAFANAVAEEGAEKFASIDTSVSTSAEQLEKFSATLQNVGKTFAAGLANFFGPLAEFLSEPVAAIAAFGILAKTVLGTTIRELTGGLKNLGPAAQRVADRFSDFTVNSKKLADINVRTKETLLGLNLRFKGLSKVQAQEFNQLVKLGRERELSRQELSQLSVLTKQNADALDKRRKALIAANKPTKNLDAEITKLNKTSAIFNERATIGSNAAQKLGRGFVALSRGIGVASSVLIGVVGFISTLVTALSFLTIAVTAVLKAFGVFDEVAEFLNRVKRAVQEILGLTPELRAYREILDELGGTVNDIEFKNAAEGIRRFAEATGTSNAQAAKQVEILAAGNVQLKEFAKLGGRSILQFEEEGTGFRERTPGGFRQKLTQRERDAIKERNDLRQQDLLFQRAAVELNNRLITGNASLETIEKQRAAFRRGIAKATDDTVKADRELISNLIEEASAQERILNTRKQIEKTFSAQLKAADKLQDLLVLNQNGNITLAKSDRERVSAQRRQLEAAIKNDDLLSQSEGRRKAALQNQKLALNVIGGIFQKVVTESVKLTAELEKQNLALAKDIALATEKREADQIRNTINLLKAQETLRKANVNAQLKSLDLQTKITLQAQKAKDAIAKINEEFEKQISETGVLGVLSTPRIGAALELKLATQDAARLDRQADTQIKSLIEQRAIQEKAAQDEKAALAQRQQLEVAAAESARDTALLQRDFADAAADLALEQQKFRIESLKSEAELLQKNRDALSLIFKQLEVSLRASLGEGFTFAQADERLRTAGPGGTSLLSGESRRGNAELEREFQELRALQFNPETDRATLFRATEVFIQKSLNAINPLIDEGLKGLKKNIEDVNLVADQNTLKSQQLRENIIKNTEEELAALKVTQEAERIKQQTASEQALGGLDLQIQKLEDAKTAREKELEALEKFLTLSTDPALRVLGETLGTIFDELQKGLTDLFVALADGTFTLESFKEGIGSLINNVLSSFVGAAVENFIINPIKEALFGPMKASIIRTGSGNAQLVTLAKLPDLSRSSGRPRPENPFAGQGDIGPFGNTGGASIIEEQNKKTNSIFDNFFNKAQGIFGKLTQGFGNVFDGILGLGQRAFGGIGSFISDIFGSILGSPSGGGILGFVGGLFMNSGGLVHMAQGGMMRDRIPAMLEPGEFVIRRPMAKAIGGPALGAMNATGQLPQQPVVVNIRNEGTPQEAQAKQPRLDADKIVVDIVTRDLRNNGPIRQSLRGGSM